MVLSNDHIIGLDYPAIEPNPNSPSEPNLTIGRSSESGVNKSFDSVVEIQIGVPYDLDVSHRYSDSPNDEFLPVESIISVDFGLHVKYDLPMYRSLNFVIDEYSLIFYQGYEYS